MLCSCSQDHASMTKILLVSGTARFDRNDDVVLNLISKNFRPVLVIEGVAKIPTLSVTSLIVAILMFTFGMRSLVFSGLLFIMFLSGLGRCFAAKCFGS